VVFLIEELRMPPFTTVYELTNDWRHCAQSVVFSIVNKSFKFELFMVTTALYTIQYITLSQWLGPEIMNIRVICQLPTRIAWLVLLCPFWHPSRLPSWPNSIQLQHC